MINTERYIKIGIAGVMVSIVAITALLIKYKEASAKGQRMRMFGLVVAGLALLASIIMVVLLYHSMAGRDALLG